MKISEGTNGVFMIAATPFTERGELDLDSTDRLVDFYLSYGVAGITILGMMGEASKLTVDETSRFMRRALARVDGRVPIVVGVSNPGIAPLVELAREAMDAGAAGVMITPISTLRTEEQTVELLRASVRDAGAGRAGGAAGLSAGHERASVRRDHRADHRSLPAGRHAQARGLPRAGEAHPGAPQRGRRPASACQHPRRQWRALSAAGACARRRRRDDRLRLSGNACARSAGCSDRATPRAARTCSTVIFRCCGTRRSRGSGLRCARKSCVDAAPLRAASCALPARNCRATITRSSTG